jgi:osmotically-inducible protein OsmY
MLARLRRMATRPSVAVDDQAVVQRVRSDALRDVGVSPREVAVEVQDGYVRLSGSIASRTLSTDLVERVRKVPGVRNVSAELRIVGD